MLAITTPEARALALLDEHAATLDRVQRTTVDQTTLVTARRYYAKVRSHRAAIVDEGNPAFRAAAVQITLETFGPNGIGPAIDSLITTARFHSFHSAPVATGANAGGSDVDRSAERANDPQGILDGGVRFGSSCAAVVATALSPRPDPHSPTARFHGREQERRRA